MKYLSSPFFVAVLVVLAVNLPSALGAKPNIVVIMADDIGLGDIGYYHRQHTGGEPPAPTPNIDRLISEGMRFSDAHSPSSLCAPTRFSMMTGNYSYRNSSPQGVWTPTADARIEPKYTTVARLAKAGGYHTSFFGKWGLGGVWTKKKPDYATEEQGARYYGFDYTLTLPQGIQDPPYIFYENQNWMKLKPDSELTHIPVEQTGYGGDDPESKKDIDRSGIGDSNWDPSLVGPTLAMKAVAYIENQTSSHPDEPFYLYYCSQAVHLPHTPPAELDGVKIAGATAGLHGDMIVELDTQVGMIVKALKKAGVYDDTLLIFTSDNGGLNTDKSLQKTGHDSSNGLSGKKGSVNEGGHRVPFIAVWPGKITPDSVCGVPIVGHDTVATIAALAGQEIDRSVILDSTNLLPYFLNGIQKPAHSHLMHRGGNAPFFAIRDGNWKLIMKFAGENPQGKKFKLEEGESFPELAPVALYNLESNLNEDPEQDLLKNPEYASRVKDLLKTYKQLRETDKPTAIDP